MDYMTAVVAIAQILVNNLASSLVTSPVSFIVWQVSSLDISDLSPGRYEERRQQQ